MATQTSADDSLQTRASLLKRLKDLDDAETWDRFYRTYERAVRGLARKRGLTDAEAEEVAQEVFKRIAETIHSFEPASRVGSFRRWLYQLARWRSDDKMRERGRLTVEPIADPTTTAVRKTVNRIPAPDDVEESLEADARRQLIQVALERLKQRINPRDLQIFQQLVVEDWSVEKISAFFRIRPALVYVIRHRVGRQLREELERIQKRLQGGPRE
ncbi:MAG: sigma-70 family RNA polymerase sigma factor [Verrucomicrobiales bacterium]|nr:sigma-70 family RNA polymerase sigma factor [Verrucomicrobiales bacterium]